MRDRSLDHRLQPWALTMLRVRGIPIRIHFTFILLVLFLIWRSRSAAGPTDTGTGLLLILLVLVCVVLHELGHALMAMHRGIPIVDITLYPFGGVARLARQPQRWLVELLIAAAGPAVNLGLAFVAWVVLMVTGFASGAITHLIELLLWSNLIIAGFNLVPAFPLDGGRILRSLLASVLGWVRATIWAASIGQIFAFLLILLGLYYEPWLILAGALILPGANSELRRALTMRTVTSSTVSDVMSSRWQEVPAHTTLAAIAGRGHGQLQPELLVTEAGQVVGFVPAARVRELKATGAAAEVGEVMQPVGPEISSDRPVLEALELLEGAAAEAAPVVSSDQALVGIVTRPALERARSLLERLSHLTG
jgi:Zn-dependent protease